MTITYLPPLSLYIHVPWCVKKCPYCDFNSHKAGETIPEQAYITALLEDLEQELPSIWGRSITSIFIGGGTPSLLSASAMDKLLSGIRARLPFMSDIEITMEANPGTVEADKFKGFFDAGINRISLGVQSFNNRFLKTLGRIHCADEAANAFNIAREAGFKNINIDLMYALPDQTIEQAVSDLKIATALKPEHLSWYQLTLEPNTQFHHQPPSGMADDDLLADISEKGLEFLQQKNYQRYEVSAFSLNNDNPSWHNTNYWQFGDYVGIGAGAHGKVTRADTQQIIRTSKKRSPKNYLDKQTPFIDKQRVIQPQEFPFEFIMNTMRLKDGVDSQSFFQRTGIALSHIQPAIDRCKERGLLNQSNGVIKPTELGFNFLNEIFSEFNEENFSSLSDKVNISVKELK